MINKKILTIGCMSISMGIGMLVPVARNNIDSYINARVDARIEAIVSATTETTIETLSTKKPSNQDTSFDIDYDIPIYLLDSADYKDYANTEHLLDALPISIQESLYKEGWSIYLTDHEHLYGYMVKADPDQEDGGVLGYTNNSDNTIFIDASSVGQAEILYHEIGHAIMEDDVVSAIIHSDLNSTQIIDEAKDLQFHSDMIPHEYFYDNFFSEGVAEMFYEYMMYPTEFYENTPDFYVIYDGIVNR